jgi:glucuronoarabinoxylan endo-1,4-beta-xylanase
MKLRRAPLLAPIAYLALVMTAGRTAAAADAVVSPLQAQQRIDGFGASSAWTGGYFSSADEDLLFSADSGFGLSLLRVHIQPCNTVNPCQLTTGELRTAQAAVARGASVWAAPWTPPAAWKSDFGDAGQSLNGGSLLAAHYDDWANALVGFVGYMHSNGVDLVGVSAQNEPDFGCTNYECCSYSPSQLDDFVSNHLGPAFQSAQSAGTIPTAAKLIAPETEGWNGLRRFTSALLGDATGGSYIGTVATHEYNGSPSAVATAGKTLWETEISDKMTSGVDPGMGSALVVAGLMRDALVVANVNAWHYWWIRPNQGEMDNSALWDNSTAGWSKRLSVMGNYSKFVRPGYSRVNATEFPGGNLSVTAYAETPTASPPSGKIVLVVINGASTPASETFLFDGVTTDPSWAAWVTSSSTDVLSQAKTPPTFQDNQVCYTFPAQSVTTLVGSATGPGAAVTADAGVSLSCGPPPGPPAPSGPDAGAAGAAVVASAAPGRPNSGLACSTAPPFSGGAKKLGALGATALFALFAASRRRRRRGT